MGPRRIFAALAVLAIAAVAGTATVAFASDGPGSGVARLSPSERRDQAAGVTSTSDHGHERQHEGDGEPSGQSTEQPGTTDPGTQGSNGGSGGTGGSDVGVAETPGGVTVAPTGGSGLSAGVPSAPIEAPAAAASGPAPDAAAAAPEFTALAAGPALAEVLAEPESGPLDGLPALGVIGAVPDAVADPPAAARELLSTGTGRSLAVIVGLMAAIGVFLSIHRRADRGDRKLAAASTAPDLARFR